MATPSGISAQLMIGEETTYGTGVTPDRGYEFVDEKLKADIERLESKGLRSGKRVQRSDRWAPGRKVVGGPLTIELVNKSMGRLFKHIFGTVSTSALVDSAYTHTFTPADLGGKALTVQVGRPDLAGTVQPFTYEGCKIKGFELGGQVGEIAQLKLDMVAEDELTTTGLAAASYPASLTLLTFVQGTLTIAGSPVNVRGVTVKGDNGLKDDRFFMGSQIIKEPLEAKLHTYGVDIDADFENLTAYNRYVNGTEAALVALWQGALIGVSSKFEVKVTANVRFDGDTPNVGGPDLLTQPLKSVCLDSGSGPATAIQLDYKTTDATP